MLKGGKQCTTQLVKGAGNHVTGSLRDFRQHLRNSCKDICCEWQHFTNPHLAEVSVPLPINVNSSHHRVKYFMQVADIKFAFLY